MKYPPDNFMLIILCIVQGYFYNVITMTKLENYKPVLQDCLSKARLSECSQGDWA